LTPRVFIVLAGEAVFCSTSSSGLYSSLSVESSPLSYKAAKPVDFFFLVLFNNLEDFLGFLVEDFLE
jgi:hypothetical protein